MSDKDRELTGEELEAEAAETLPEREVLSVVDLGDSGLGPMPVPAAEPSDVPPNPDPVEKPPVATT